MTHELYINTVGGSATLQVESRVDYCWQEGFLHVEDTDGHVHDFPRENVIQSTFRP